MAPQTADFPRARALAQLPPRAAGLAETLRPPTALRFFGGAAQLEVSLHAPGPALRRDVAAVFPSAPPAGRLLACVTFQFAGGGAVDLGAAAAGGDPAAAAEMDRMLGVLLRWEAGVRAALQAAGPFWSDLVDPRR